MAGHASSYEAKLSPELNTAPDLCAMVPCADVFPGATSFSLRKGQPPYVEAYAADPDNAGAKKLRGYVMLSTDITDTPAYSGKPVVTLIGMDTQGRFVGVKVLKHSEPILLLGIPESALTQFNDQYLGKSVTDKIEVGQSQPEEELIGVDAISGATVTVIAQNQIITASGNAVARQEGLIPPTQREPARFTTTGARPDWASMVKQGWVQRLVVSAEQVGLPRSAQPFIALWFGDLSHPDIGASLLGDAAWHNLQARLKPDEKAIFIIRTEGLESFKGSGFVRGGLYDRIQVRQGADLFTFRDLDYLNLYDIAAAGAPQFSESGIFIIRSTSFSSAYPWQLGFLGNRVDRATGTRSFTNFDARYWLPAEVLQGGRPAIVRVDPTWLRIWKTRSLEIAWFLALLVGVTVVYALRDHLTRRSNRKNKWPVNAFKYSAWLISIGFVGFGVMAQPSITQVLTWFHALLTQWRWTLFLSDPFIFLFWIFIIVTVFIWGRGLFCGWLCPFGSLTELIHKIAAAVGLKRFQFELPMAWHNRLKWLKYAVFLGLLAVSAFSMERAEMLAEIEPFKTTFLVGMFNRAWPYTLFVAILLGLSIFIERPFCKYLCPLGAALAMPSTFRWFGLLRKQECNSCKACAAGCGALAIDANGRIDHRECLHCLDCMVLYTDVQACPPLAQERKQRERAGLAQTPIGRDGYFIPIYPAPAGAISATDNLSAVTTGPMPSRPSAGVDPRLPTDRVVPPHAIAVNSGWAWAMAELGHHLNPWTRQSCSQQRLAFGIGLVLALVVVASWVLAITGQLNHWAIMLGWLAWSGYEVGMRLQAKCYVKDGVWWGRTYRKASCMDMLCYVGFKNLLLGAALFMALKAGGWLPL